MAAVATSDVIDERNVALSTSSYSAVDYRYDACGLDNVVLKGFHLVDDAGVENICIPNINELHDVLRSMVAGKPSALQPKEVRFLRTELGLTQAQLAAVVGRDVQTIGRWERGETPIEQAAEMVLRTFALQGENCEDLPAMDELAKLTIKASVEPPFVIDASDPPNWRAA